MARENERQELLKNPSAITVAPIYFQSQSRLYFPFQRFALRWAISFCSTEKDSELWSDTASYSFVRYSESINFTSHLIMQNVLYIYFSSVTIFGLTFSIRPAWAILTPYLFLNSYDWIGFHILYQKGLMECYPWMKKNVMQSLSSHDNHTMKN